MKPGIGLLDVVVGLAIASILSLLLYRSLAQSNRTLRVIDSIVETQTQLVFFGDRMMKDVMGACAPKQGLVKEAESSTQQPTGKPAPEQASKDQAAKAPADAKKKEKKRLKDLFVVEHFAQTPRGPSSDKPVFTFITTNPLVVYGEATPRLVRVAYSLEQGTGDLWQLKRSESEELLLKKFRDAQAKKSVPSYTILTNIQSFSVTCIAAKQEEEKPKKAEQAKKEVPKKEKEKEKKKRPPEYERLTSWNDEQRIKDGEKALLPDFIEIKGVTLDNRHKREVPFTYLLPIAAYAQLKQSADDEHEAAPGKQPNQLRSAEQRAHHGGPHMTLTQKGSS